MIQQGGQTGGDMEEMQGQGLVIPTITPPTGGGAGKEDTSVQPMRGETQEGVFLLLFSSKLASCFLLVFDVFFSRPILCHQPDISGGWDCVQVENGCQNELDHLSRRCVFTWIWFQVRKLETTAPLFRCVKMLQLSVETNTIRFSFSSSLLASALA